MIKRSNAISKKLALICLMISIMIFISGCPPKISKRAAILMRIAGNLPKKVRNKATTLYFKNGSYIRALANGKVLIKPHNKKAIILSSNRDLNHLFLGATRYAAFDSYADIDSLSTSQGVAELIQRNVNAFYAKYKSKRYKLYTQYGGNRVAKNIWGSGQFRYQRIVQVHSFSRLKKKVPPRYLTQINGKLFPKGLECNAAAIFQIMKSLGLIPPDLSNLQLCDKYTDLYSYGMRFRDPKTGKWINNNRPGTDPYRIKSSMGFDQAMRGFYASTHKLNPHTALKIARLLARNDWAKLCGMSNKKFKLILGKKNITAQLKSGFTAGAMKEWFEPKYSMWMRHHVTVTAMGRDQNKLSNPPKKNYTWIQYDDPWHALTDGTQTRWSKNIFKNFFAIVVQQ